MNELTLEQRVRQEWEMEGAARAWGTAASIAKEMLLNAGLEVSDDQLASTTTHIAMSAPGWRITQKKWEPRNYVDDVHGALRAPMEPEVLRTYMLDHMDADGPAPTKKHVYSMLGSLFTEDDQRHDFLKFLFGNPSSKELSPGQRWILIRWGGFRKETDWSTNPIAIIEARAILEYAEANNE